MDDPRAFATRALHHAPPKTTVPSQPMAPPIVQSSSFHFESMEAMDPIFAGEGSGYIYSRASNPTVAELEQAVAELEGCDAGIAFGSGMGAIHGVVAALCSKGDQIIAPQAVYGGTFGLLRHIMPRFGVETRFVDNRDLAAYKAALTPNTKIIWAETIGNPGMEVVDLEALAELAHEAGAKLVVDSSFTTPALYRPLEHGADLVVHSLTKYLGGHGDLIAGLVVGPAETIDPMRFDLMEIGATCAPFVAWLVLRGLKTLALRMERHSKNALKIAQFLQSHYKVRGVNYPGLYNHPDHARAARLMPEGMSGMLSFKLNGGEPAALKLAAQLELFLCAGSLGETHSLVVLPSRTSHRALSEAEQRAAGVDGLVRLSCGIEDVDDLIDDLDQALEPL